MNPKCGASSPACLIVWSTWHLSNILPVIFLEEIFDEFTRLGFIILKVKKCPRGLILIPIPLQGWWFLLKQGWRLMPIPIPILDICIGKQNWYLCVCSAKSCWIISATIMNYNICTDWGCFEAKQEWTMETLKHSHYFLIHIIFWAAI